MDRSILFLKVVICYESNHSSIISNYRDIYALFIFLMGSIQDLYPKIGKILPSIYCLCVESSESMLKDTTKRVLRHIENIHVQYMIYIFNYKNTVHQPQGIF